MPRLNLIDSLNRRLNYLRISVTDRCNLQCIYCTPTDCFQKFTHEEILTYEEIIRLIRIGVSLGMTKIRITGGEPLVRRDIDDFLIELGRVEGLNDISLTTNGVYLNKHIEAIRASGIRRLNISLDTLSREKFQKITGHDVFDQVWKNILMVQYAGFNPVKINVVALRGINEDELADLAALSLKYPFQVRFIEHMPIGLTALSQSEANDRSHKPILAPEIMERISVHGKLIPVDRYTNDGPAEMYRYEQSLSETKTTEQNDRGFGQIGVIRPLSHHFCASCNRLRLTSHGQLRPCLLSDYEKDIRVALRNGHSDSELSEIFIETARFKPSQHSLNEQQSSRVNGQMNAIGG